MDKILATNIKTISRLLTEGSIRATDLAVAAVERAHQTQKYNAFITVTSKQAKEQAQESDNRHKTNQTVGELDGIPVVIKDNFCTANIRTTCASRMLENFIPTYNATIYQRLIDAGAVLIGKSNLDQFAMGSGTVDSLFGPTKNIWHYQDRFRISGGSSGGSAVAVANGACLAAIGSDTGGSTRNPAAYCGLIGLKPTYGLVSRWGLIPLVNSMDVVGILTRNVDDCVSVLNAVAGHDPKDSTSLRRRYRKIRLPSVGKMSLKGVKIGIPVEYHCEFLDKQVWESWNEIAGLLQDHGATIRQVSMPHTRFSIVCYSILNQGEVASNMARYDSIEFGLRCTEIENVEKLMAKSRNLGFNDVVKDRILAGNYFLLNKNYEKYYNKAMRVRRLILNDFDDCWEQVHFLLTPTTLSEAPFYDDFIGKTNRDQCAVQDFCTQPANMAGVPAISLPIKLSRSGLPLSLQVMGPNLSESSLLALAKYIESLVKFPHFLNR